MVGAETLDFSVDRNIFTGIFCPALATVRIDKNQRLLLGTAVASVVCIEEL